MTVWIAAGIALLVPAGLLLWLALSPSRSRIHLLSSALLVAAVLVLLTFSVAGAGYVRVLRGGGSALVNHHALSNLSEQRYALDITALNRWGVRAQGIAPPVHPDPTDPYGNHVVLLCGSSSVILAHLQSGSVAVGISQRVAAGDVLGRVGNSGMTFEPHLHIHAVTGRQPDAAGMPVPMLIDGRFLIVGDRFGT